MYSFLQYIYSNNSKFYKVSLKILKIDCYILKYLYDINMFLLYFYNCLFAYAKYYNDMNTYNKYTKEMHHSDNRENIINELFSKYNIYDNKIINSIITYYHLSKKYFN
jgi:hypothetical protein